MGTLSISGINKDGLHYLEILGGHLLNGELLSDYEYCLRSQPLTDNLLPRLKGLEPYTSPVQYSLECSVCGDWAGNLVLPQTMTEVEMATAAMAVQNRLCPVHWRRK